MQAFKGLGRGLGSLIPNLRSGAVNQKNDKDVNFEIEKSRLNQPPLSAGLKSTINQHFKHQTESNISAKPANQPQNDRPPKTILTDEYPVLVKSADKISEIELKSASQTSQERIFNLAIDDININPFQPRQNFKDQALTELADSIKEHGIIQPLITSSRSDGKYDLIAGERRLRAAKLIGLKTVPAVVRLASDLEKLELALIENIQREDLNPLEYAQALNRLVSEFNLTQQELAKRLGKNRSTVANILRYLELPAEIQDSLRQREISEGQAKVLLSLPDSASQFNLWQKIKTNKLTVRQTEAEARNVKIKVKGYTRAGPDANILALEQQIEAVLGTKVKIDGRLNKGRLTIEYYSVEELNNLVKQLGA